MGILNTKLNTDSSTHETFKYILIENSYFPVILGFSESDT